MQQLKLCICSLTFLLFAVPSIGQTITAHTEFHSTQAQKTVNVEEDLFLRFTFDKSLASIIMKRGTEGIQSIYGVLKINFGGSEFMTDFFPVAYAETASIQEFDLALSLVMKEFHKVTLAHKEDWTGKDDLLLHVLAQTNNPLNTWMKAIAARALPGQTHAITAELYIMENTKEPYNLKPPVATGAFDLKVGKESLLPLYGTRIPAMYRPVPDNGIVDALHQKNVGNILWSKKAIPSQKADSKAFASSFKLKDKAIHGRIYLPKSIRNLGAGVGNSNVCTFKALYYVNDQLVNEEEFLLAASICEKETSLPIALWSKNKPIQEKLQAALEAIKEKECTLRVDLGLEYKDGSITGLLPLGSSTITLSK